MTKRADDVPLPPGEECMRICPTCVGGVVASFRFYVFKETDGGKFSF